MKSATSNGLYILNQTIFDLVFFDFKLKILQNKTIKNYTNQQSKIICLLFHKTADRLVRFRFDGNYIHTRRRTIHVDAECIGTAL